MASLIMVQMVNKVKSMNLCKPVQYTKVDIQASVILQGFWSNMLDIGDFYYELGVQIVEVRLLHSTTRYL